MQPHSYIRRFVYWWGKQKFIFFVLIGFMCYLLIINCCYYLISLFQNNINEDLAFLVKEYFTEDSNYLLVFFMLCIVSPIIETIVFQYILIQLIRRFLSKKWIWQVLLSGICFGLAHGFNLSYLLSGIVVGSFFSFCFVLYEKYTDINKAIIAVATMHGLINCIPFFRQVFLNAFS